MPTKFRLPLTVILVAALMSVISKGQTPVDSIKSKHIGILPVPALGYSPETDFYFGAVALFTFKPDSSLNTRTSNGKVEFNYTLKKQVILETGWNYFLPEEKWFSRGTIHYSKYPDVFYGIGDKTPDSNEVTFSSHRFLVQVNFLKKIADRTFFGPAFRYGHYENIEYIKGNHQVLTLLKPESYIGGGLTLLCDTRNNLLNPTSGFYGEITYTLNAFQSNTYQKFILDLRHYYAFSFHQGSENPRNPYNTIYPHTLSFRLLSEFTSVPAPFFDNPSPGGDIHVRGYLLGRYRDLNMITFQTEYRSPYIWRWAIAAFGGISSLFHNTETINTNDLKPNYGLGIRFLTDRKEKINLRLDYAIGNNNQDGFYISFGESF